MRVVENYVSLAEPIYELDNIRRFSEDLDFNAVDLTRKEFETVTGKVHTELNRLDVEFSLDFHHWDNLYVAYLTFPEVEKSYGVISRYSKKKGIVIKVDMNNPSWTIKIKHCRSPVSAKCIPLYAPP